MSLGARNLPRAEDLTLADVTMTSLDVSGSIEGEDIHINDNTTAAYDLVLESDSDGTVLTADRTLTFDVNNESHTIDLFENLSIGNGADVTITAVGAARTLTLNESLTIGDGTDITITGVTAARTITLNENFTVGGGTDITITGVTAARTITLNENLTVGGGYDVTVTAAGAARTLTLNESLTIGDGNDGTITFSASGDTLTVEETSIVNQDLSSDATVTFGNYSAVNKLTACTTNAGALDYSAGSKTLTVEDSATVSQDYSSDASPTFAEVITTIGYRYPAETTATPSAAFTVDWTASHVQRVTITGTTLDVTFTDPAAPCKLALVVVQGDGDDTIDWTNEASILWPGAVDPTLSTGSGDIDLITFYFDGTSYLGVANYDFG